jgi:hypothetical protein
MQLHCLHVVTVSYVNLLIIWRPFTGPYAAGIPQSSLLKYNETCLVKSDRSIGGNLDYWDLFRL